MKAFIYSGGEIYPENITEHPKASDICIAADSGFANAKALGERVDIALGDFDSLSGGAGSIPDGVDKLTVPAEKDETDTQLAVNVALSKGADDIVIVGGLSGRLDHTLSNLAILEALFDLGVPAVILDGRNRARYIRSTSTLIPRSGYKYLSLLAGDEKVKGVSVEGCKYPLKNKNLTKKYQYTVSNEIKENCALVSVRRGGLCILESRDV